MEGAWRGGYSDTSGLIGRLEDLHRRVDDEHASLVVAGGRCVVLHADVARPIVVMPDLDQVLGLQSSALRGGGRQSPSTKRLP